MIVQVDTSQITELEDRIEELSTLLTAAVSKRKDKKLRLTAPDLQACVGAGIEVKRDDSGVTLSYRKPQP